MRHLHITGEPKEFAIPPDLVTQTVAILARKRVGKTYTASVIAEEFCKAKLPFVVLDPTGAWWGLRGSSDGQGPGFPVVIIGGAHGDVPLEPTAGKVIADLVIEHPGYYVLDLSLTNSNAEQDRFATDFAEQLYRRKSTHPEPLHLFIDEADSFAPQRPFPGQQRMLGAFEAIVRRGGIRGIGVTMITQRPAILNKNVLTQTEVLIALQTTGPQDRAAVQEWVKSHGTKAQQETFMNSLAGLQKGQAWIWSPSWLDVFKLVRIRPRETFNSSATPEVGARPIEPAALAGVDLKALQVTMAATIEKAKADDPKALKAKIAELEKALKVAQTVTAPIPEIQIEQVSVVTDEDILRLKELVQSHDEVSQRLTARVDYLSDMLKKIVHPPAPRHDVSRPEPIVSRKRLFGASEQPIVSRNVTNVSSDTSLSLGAGERKILSAVAQYPHGVTREQLTVMTGYKRSSRDTYLQRLFAAGYAGHVSSGTIMVTESGKSALGPAFEPLPTGHELQVYWKERLTGGERVLFEVLVRDYPNAVDRDVLTEQTGYKRSSRDTYLQRLAVRQLITIERGAVRASDLLFD